MMEGIKHVVFVEDDNSGERVEIATLYLPQTPREGEYLHFQAPIEGGPADGKSDFVIEDVIHQVTAGECFQYVELSVYEIDMSPESDTIGDEDGIEFDEEGDEADDEDEGTLDK